MRDGEWGKGQPTDNYFTPRKSLFDKPTTEHSPEQANGVPEPALELIKYRAR